MLECDVAASYSSLCLSTRVLPLTRVCEAKGLVLLSSLMSIRLFETENSSTQSPRVPDNSVVVHVPSNGRCFWSSLFLARAAAPQQLLGWYIKPRNASGETTREDSKREDEMVLEYGHSLRLKAAVKSRLDKGVCTHHADLAPWTHYCRRCAQLAGVQ